MSDHNHPIKNLDRARAVLRPLARLAAGATGADIERIVKELSQKTRREGKGLLWSDVEAVLQGDRARMPDDLIWRVAVHEAGHALSWTLLDIGEVQLVTIGTGGGGSTSGRFWPLAQQDQDWLMRMIVCDLAGRAAELLVFGNALAGSGGSDGSDLALATERATMAETVLGFSEHQPLLYRQITTPLSGLGLDRDLRERVNSRLEEAMARASVTVATHRHTLDDLARALAESHVLEGADVRRIIAGTNQAQATAVS